MNEVVFCACTGVAGPIPHSAWKYGYTLEGARHVLADGQHVLEGYVE